MIVPGPLECDIPSMSSADRVAKLRRNDRPFHIILAQQFDPEIIARLCQLAEMMRVIQDDPSGAQFLHGILSHKRAMLYFIQPSTRTFLSFGAACDILGASYSEVRTPSTSSELKGESEIDSIRVFSQYHDVIIMRHPRENFCEEMAHMLSGMRRTIPLINAGSGKDQHPTQALLDIYTLHRCLADRRIEGRRPDFTVNHFQNKTIAFVGDLKRGRTVRSLVYLLCRYPGVRLMFVSPPELDLEGDIVEYVERRGIPYEQSRDLPAIIGDCDAVYMTRLQDEHDLNGESKSIDYRKFCLSAEMSHLFKPNLAIMHPLPRREELDINLDRDPRAVYWEQVRNGMWIRAAMLAYLFNVEDAVMYHYQTNFI
jgi:aspartate carbamoyltransferase catalytic subunit